MNEAELLFTGLLGCSRTSLYTGGRQKLPQDKGSLIAGVLRRRIKGEPLQYILGRTEFMGLDFRVTPDVLIPRPETEILVETVLGHAGKVGARLRILDIGTGSGCVAVSLAHYLPRSAVCAVEISAAALQVARGNAYANRCRVDFLNADLFPPGDGKFDIIVSNPPYIPAGELGCLQREVLFEPRQALSGGDDGLYFYRRICAGCAGRLVSSGLLIVEIGYGRAQDVRALISSAPGMKVEDTVKDYAGIERVVVARRRT